MIAPDFLPHEANLLGDEGPKRRAAETQQPAPRPAAVAMKLFRQLQGTKAFSRGELRVLGDLIEAGVQQLEDSKTDEEVWNDLDREEAAEQERVQRAAAKAGPPNGRRQASRKRY